MTTYVPFEQRTARGRQQYVMAVAYAEGRLDGGDTRLADAFERLYPDIEQSGPASVLVFANWVANQADDEALGFEPGRVPMPVMYLAYVTAAYSQVHREQAESKLRHPSNQEPKE